ncbi:chromate efflux transporter [Thiomicrorhabdus indica]|uniref:chromate efflux transporter n=1 Tax=Thiomicrorhabdus indica TaxID=2267253 RepID=UPI002AA6C172|nr:chromate efflux transporter [Thiomicrorhabdus indica]
MKSLQVFWQFFILGWTSFGGPAAHLGIFQQRFVVELKWLSEADYLQLVALSQFLPGPGSSQVGFAIGRQHAGMTGAWAAFLGFTLPSFLILLWVALYQPASENVFYAQMILGLKLLAVVVVADATLKMFQSFCQTRATQTTAVLVAIVLLLLPFSWSQIAVLAIAFVIGAKFFNTDTNSLPAGKDLPNARSWFAQSLLLIGLGLILIHQFFPEMLNPTIQLFANFAQAGALVFGGGHVVLPLLQNSIGEQISNDLFLSGYAFAQAVPGPMFSVASFYGAHLLPETPVLGAIIATLGVFLPGLLLMLALQNSWQNWAQNPQIQGGILLLNAAVVGLLIATLFTPVFTSAVSNSIAMAWVLVGLLLLRIFQLKVLWLLPIFALGFPSSQMTFL